MSAAPHARPFRILVVEDNEADIYLLEKALKSAGLDCEVTVITNGAAALAFLRNPENQGAGRPDMTVLDLNLPRKGGAEVLTAIRQSDLADTRVAVVTSSPLPEDRARMEALDIEGYFTKGPDLEDYLKIGEELKKLVVDIVARRRELK